MALCIVKEASGKGKVDSNLISVERRLDIVDKRRISEPNKADFVLESVATKGRKIGNDRKSKSAIEIEVTTALSGIRKLVNTRKENGEVLKIIRLKTTPILIRKMKSRIKERRIPLTNTNKPTIDIIIHGSFSAERVKLKVAMETNGIAVEITLVREEPIATTRERSIGEKSGKIEANNLKSIELRIVSILIEVLNETSQRMVDPSDISADCSLLPEGASISSKWSRKS